MVSKILYLDLETTGLVEGVHGIIQLAAIVEIDGEITDEVDLRMRPMLKHEISPEALSVHGLTEDEIRNYPHADFTFKQFESLLTRYVNKYEKLDKFILAGYNVAKFDERFLRQMFIDNAATREDRQRGGYYGSWFFWPVLDVQTYLANHIAEHGLRLENYKLETVCKHFGIPIDAHDALSDIRATRNLYRVLRYSLLAPK